MSKEAMKLAQLAINNLIASSHATDPQHWRDARQDAVTALVAIDKALAEQPSQQEPVAWLYPEGFKALQDGKCWTAYPTEHEDCIIPLYTRPQAREPLTNEQREQIYQEWASKPFDEVSYDDLMLAVEAAHGITGEKK